MAGSPTIKPFTAEETYRIVHHLQEPAVFLNMTCGWPVLHWTVDHLSGCLGNKHVRFRLGRKKKINAPLFETHCSFVDATLAQFLSWTQGHSGTHDGPFCDYPSSEYWAYADYKYISQLLEDQPSMFEDVKWSEFGFEGRDGRESTLWIGTEGANTPCHLDSYGCNLVLQVQGRKCWHLFPPEDAAKLYPTRIPYEESSVFSQVNVLQPDLRRFPAFQRARTHSVTLEPGQVLYVPRHWWHYVESVDPVTVSVNSWIELEADDVARVSEAVTKAVVCALKTTPADDNADVWLNPTEDGVSSHNENMQYVNLAVRACAQRLRGHSQSTRDSQAVKRDCSGRVKRCGDCVPFTVPFGPHLIPVYAQQEPKGMNPNDPEVKSIRKCVIRSQLDCAESSEAAQRTDPASAVRIHRGQHECGSALSHCGEEMAEDNEGSGHATITTNDLLDCLVHPDIIMRVTELLLQRHTDQTTAACELEYSPNRKTLPH
ncbi:HSPB1-associated protein 1 homolog isoform X2 [Sphaeramia orbicularis]|uniref:HSPB1-associated protein 1 homolog isoform X2 n=1 Tax=Sphaeramia orbicularis TaxID=375764 RepID=UPI00117FA7C6|nr:HSPB1-associated protein 1 isoform X2 [Sphaeramia orbicularis]